MPTDLVFTLAAFIILWIGAGFSISGIERIARHLKISSFLVSFFALGLLTSVSELSVAYFAIRDATPEISVGNLIGGSAVLTLLFIPLLAIINRGISFHESSEPINFPLAYLVISLPVLLLIDKNLSLVDAAIMISSFFFLTVTISIKNTILERIEEVFNHNNVNLLLEVGKVLFGTVLIIFTCKFIVDTAVHYSQIFNVPPFLLGISILSLGTNLPELSILVRSAFQRKKAIAMGDYVGSAAVNTLILGLVGTFGPFSIQSGVKANLYLLPLGAILFLIFTRNKKFEVHEGLILLTIYGLFMFMEFWL